MSDLFISNEKTGLASRTLDQFVLFFGSWTVSCHVTMFMQLNLYWCIGLFLAVYVLLIGVWVKSPADDVRIVSQANGPSDRAWQNLALAVAAMILAIVWIIGLHPMLTVVWLGAVVIVGLGLVATLTGAGSSSQFWPNESAPPDPGPGAVRQLERSVLILAALVALVMLFLGRPNADDSLYASLANRVMSHPSEPLLWMDSLHGFGLGAGLTDAYRVHSYDALIGLLGWTSTLDPIRILHVLVPPVAAFLIVLAAGQLAKFLTIRHGVLLVFTFIMASFLLNDSYGFFQLQQGKHILFMLMPLLVPVLVIRFAVTGRRRHGLAIMMAVIAGSGLSSSGLYLMPCLVVGAGLTAVLLLGRTMPLLTAVRRTGLSVIAIAYPLFVTAMLFATRVSFPGPSDGSEAWALSWTPERLIDVTRHWVDEGPRLPQVFALTTLPVFVAWALSPSRAAVAVTSGVGLAFLLFLYNPIAATMYHSIPELSPVYTRIQFLAPLAFLLAISLLPALFCFRRPRQFFKPPGLFSVILLAMILVMGPPLFRGQTPFEWAREMNQQGVATKWPWQTPIDRQLALSTCARDLLGPDRYLLAPEWIGTHIAMLPDAPGLVLNRDTNMRWISRVVGRDEAALRRNLIHWVQGGNTARAIAGPLQPAILSEALGRLGIDAVVVNGDNPDRALVGTTLSKAGFSMEKSCSGYNVWILDK